MPPGVTNFPATLDDDNSLLVLQNKVLATMPTVTNSAVTWTVTSVTGTPSSQGVATIVSPTDETVFEVIRYTGYSGGTLSGVTRGIDGTSAQSWTAGAPIFFDGFSGIYHNVLKDSIKAIETKMGSGSSVPAAGRVLSSLVNGQSSWELPAGDVVLLNPGSTNFSSVPSVSFNNIFTSAYRNYRISIAIDSSTTTTAPYIRMRVSSADYTASEYYGVYQDWNGGGTAITAAVQSGALTYWNGWVPAYAGTIADIYDLDIFNPQAAEATYVRGWSAAQYTTWRVFMAGLFNGNAYDGFSFIFGSNCTGKVMVYGYKS